MEYDNPILELDSSYFRLVSGIKILEAIHDAIRSGEFAGESYVDAIWGAYDYLCAISKEMKGYIDAAIEEQRKRKGM